MGSGVVVALKGPGSSAHQKTTWMEKPLGWRRACAVSPDGLWESSNTRGPIWGIKRQEDRAFLRNSPCAHHHGVGTSSHMTPGQNLPRSLVLNTLPAGSPSPRGAREQQGTQLHQKSRAFPPSGTAASVSGFTLAHTQLQGPLLQTPAPSPPAHLHGISLAGPELGTHSHHLGTLSRLLCLRPGHIGDLCKGCPAQKGHVMAYPNSMGTIQATGPVWGHFHKFL